MKEAEGEFGAFGPRRCFEREGGVLQALSELGWLHIRHSRALGVGQ